MEVSDLKCTPSVVKYKIKTEWWTYSEYLSDQSMLHCLVFHVNPSTPSDCCLWNAALPWTGPLIRLDCFEVGLGIICFSKWRTFFRLLSNTALWVYADMYRWLCFESFTQTFRSSGWNWSHGSCFVQQLQD